MGINQRIKAAYRHIESVVPIRRNMDIKVVVSLIGIGGVLSSALVQFMLGTILEKKKNNNEVRTQSYIDYINGVAELAQLSKEPNTGAGDRNIALAKVASATGRIAIYGGREVIGALAEFSQNHTRLETDESFNSFMLIVAEMRKETLNNKSLLDTDIDELRKIFFWR